jgi:thioredoxin reductase (NADPH)
MKMKEVKKIEKKEDGDFVLHTDKEKYESKTVIIAMGLSPRRLAIPGEEELTGKGISYCANCDGPFYKGKEVVVVGGGNSALDAAEVLSKIASKVYLVHRREEFRAFEAVVEEVENKENIELVLNSEVKEIIGKEKVEKVKVLNKETGAEREIVIDGVFIEIGRIAHTDLVADLAERDELKQIKADKKQMTKTPGLFAGGDVVSGEFKQITIASGEATIAALAAYQYIQQKQGKKIKKVLDRSTD